MEKRNQKLKIEIKEKTTRKKHYCKSLATKSNSMKTVQHSLLIKSNKQGFPLYCTPDPFSLNTDIPFQILGFVS